MWAASSEQSAETYFGVAVLVSELFFLLFFPPFLLVFFLVVVAFLSVDAGVGLAA